MYAVFRSVDDEGNQRTKEAREAAGAYTTIIIYLATDATGNLLETLRALCLHLTSDVTSHHRSLKQRVIGPSAGAAATALIWHLAELPRAGTRKGVGQRGVR